MKAYDLSITAAGSAGAATGTATMAVQAGQLVGVLMQYTSAPATTDVTVSEALNGVSRTVLTQSNNATAKSFAPTVPATDATGAAILSAYQPEVLYGGVVTVSVAQANAGTIVNVRLLVED